MKKYIALFLAMAMTLTLLVSCSNNTPSPDDKDTNTEAVGATKENPHVWKVGTSAGLVNGKHVIYDLILKVKEEVEAATDSRYQIEPYHSSQLGSDRIPSKAPSWVRIR